MTTTIKEATNAVKYFKTLQKEHNFIDHNTSLMQDKWDMKDVLDDIDNKAEAVKLFKFFMMTSSDMSLKHFFFVYHDYLTTMQNIIRQRKQDKATLEKTILKKKEQIDNSGN